MTGPLPRPTLSAVGSVAAPVAVALAVLAVAVVVAAWAAAPAGASGAAPSADAGGPYSLAEGGDVTLTAAATSDPEGDTLTYRWDLDNDGQYDDAVGEQVPAAWATLAAAGIDDDGVYNIAVQVDDGTSTDVAATTVTVSDTAPTVTLTGPGAAAAGVPYALDVAIDDPGDDTVSAWVVSWGDGAITTGSGDPGTLTHTYAGDGLTRGVMVHVTNEDGSWSESDLVVAFYDNPDKVSRFDADGGAKITDFPNSDLSSAYGIAIAPDGLIYASGFSSRNIVRYDPTDNSVVGTFAAPDFTSFRRPRGLAFGPDGNLYVAGDGDEGATVIQIDAGTGAVLGDFLPEDAVDDPKAVLFTDDGSMLVSDHVNDSIHRFDATTGADLGVLVNTSFGARPTGMAIGPDGNLYVAMYGDETVEVYDPSTGTRLSTFVSSGLDNPHSLAFGPDGHLWVSNYWGEDIMRFDRSTGAYLDTPVTESLPAGPMGLAFLPQMQVTVTDDLAVNATGDAGDQTPGDGLCDTGGTNAAADDECTLRAALEEANARPGTAVVTFDIPTADSGHSGGTWTITPATALPTVTDPVTIDGTTQAGAAVATVAAPGAFGGTLAVEVSGSSLGATDHGLALATGADGSEIRGLAFTGFTGASASALHVSGSGGHRIVGNHLGSTAAGTADGANRVGVTITGTAPGVVVGGAAAGDRNLFGAHTAEHVLITGTGATGAVVEGNDLGYRTGGATAATGPDHGIRVADGATATIGGTSPGAANRITGAGVGVVVDSGGSNAMAAIVGNHIAANTGLGIDLADDGVTANDAGDADAGPNGLLNSPEPSAATETSPGQLTVTLALDVPAGSYRIDAYANPGGTDPSGRGEGEQHVGSAVVSHPGDGSRSYTVTVPGSNGDQLTLTATEVAGAETFGATSEFSAPVLVGAPAGRWRLDEGSGTTALDSSGRGVDGTITGATYTAGVSGTALDFGGGAEERITIPHQSDGSLDPGAGDFSLELWFANTEAPPASTWRTLAFKHDWSNGYELLIWDDGGTPTLSFQLYEASTNWAVHYAGPELTDGAWHHVVGVIDGATLRLYIDGNEVATGPNGATSVALAVDLRLGAVSGASWSDYDGRLDEISLHGRALSPTEVSDAYNAVDTVVVNSTGDGADLDPGDGTCHTGGTNALGGPECTLRAALAETNATARLTTVRFDLSTSDPNHSSGTWLIQPSSALPAITGAVTVDASTQTGWTQDPLVQLDGTSAGAGVTGITADADGTVVRGLALTGWSSRGASTTNSAVTVVGNWFGIALDGTAAANGTNDLVIEGSADGVFIGGSATADRNLFGGGGTGGGLLVNGTVTNTTIQGNWFGFLPDGITSSSWADDMLVVDNSAGVIAIADNRFGHGGSGGVVHASSGAVTVTGNTFGLGLDDSVARVDVPVRVTGAGPIRVGGTDPADANTIVNASGDGVRVEGASARATVLGNTIHSNLGLGIDLLDDGPTPNDAGDGDSGPNDLLNAPVITATSVAGGTVTVDFDLDVPAGTYRIEAFTNPSGPDPSLFGEGEVFAGAATVVHPGSGSTSFSLDYTGTTGDVITLTATEDLGGGAYGPTSEFSAARIPVVTVVVNATGDAGDQTPGDGVCDTGGVNSAGSTACTLRAVIEELNAGVAWTFIDFAFPTTEPGHSAGTWTISPASPLPVIANPADIDGTSQPGWTDDPVVGIDGSGAGTGDGLVLAGGFSRVQNLAVHAFPDDGIVISGGERSSVVGSWIGLDVTGAADGNLDEGLLVSAGASSTVLGGSNAAEGNVLSANGGDGLQDRGDDTVIRGNRVGTDPTGLVVTANGDDGMALYGQNATVADNVVSGNPDDGIFLDGAVSTVITGNLVGVGADGTTPMGNGDHGIRSTRPAVGTLIGGTGAGDGNTLSHNGGDGVTLTSSDARSAVLGNTIVANGGLGIDLADDGVTANDVGDADTGPNDRLNTPEIAGLTRVGDVVVVTFTLDVPAGTYRVEAFTNPSGVDPSGHGEGEVFQGAVSVDHGGAGAETFTLGYRGALGDRVALTATEDLGSGTYGVTSEFSATATAVAPVLDASGRRSDLNETTGLGVGTGAGGPAGDAFDLATDARLVGPGLDVTDGTLGVAASIRPDTLTGDHQVVSKRTGAGTPVYELGVDGTTAEAVGTVGVGGATVEVRGGTVSVGTWHQIHLSWDGSDAVLHVDGVEVDRAAASGTLATAPLTRAAIGARDDGSRPFDGRIDTVRIDHAPPVGARATAQHRNLADPSAHVTLGDEQTSLPGPWTADGTQARSGATALAAPDDISGAAAWAVASGLDEPGLVFRSWWWVSDPAVVDLASGNRASAVVSEQHEAAAVGGTGWQLRRRSAGSTSVGATAAGAPAAGTWVQVEVWTDQLGSSRLVVDGTEVLAWTGQAGEPASGSVGLRVGELPSGEAWYVDDVDVRKLVTPEPTVELGPLDRN